MACPFGVEALVLDVALDVGVATTVEATHVIVTPRGVQAMQAHTRGAGAGHAGRSDE